LKENKENILKENKENNNRNIKIKTKDKEIENDDMNILSSRDIPLILSVRNRRYVNHSQSIVSLDENKSDNIINVSKNSSRNKLNSPKFINDQDMKEKLKNKVKQ